MELTNLQDNISQLRKQLEALQRAMAAAARERDIRRNAQLTLQACQVRRQLLEAQAELFP